MNLDQIRAQHAYQAAAGENTDFLNLARSLPQMLQTNGLLATWAFLLARNESPHRSVLKALVIHLQGEGLLAVELTDPKEILLSAWLGRERPLGTSDLQRLTSETVAFAGWIKRAAEALCDHGK
jgi:CRISPR/Cas system CMR-associated protein Cmr5 small subunit